MVDGIITRFHYTGLHFDFWRRLEVLAFQKHPMSWSVFCRQLVFDWSHIKLHRADRVWQEVRCRNHMESINFQNESTCVNHQLHFKQAQQIPFNLLAWKHTHTKMMQFNYALLINHQFETKDSCAVKFWSECFYSFSSYFLLSLNNTHNFPFGEEDILLLEDTNLRAERS